MKALILAAGKGTRLRPLTYTMPKPMVPVMNKPVLFFVIDQARSGGIKEIGIVVSPDNKDTIKEAVIKEYGGSDVSFEFIVQKEPKGLAHAVRTAQPWLGDDDFVMLLGDNLTEIELSDMIEEFYREKADALILVKEVDDPTRFGVVVLDDEGNVVSLVEKPKVPPSNLAIVGVYIFSSSIHDSILRIKPSWRGEYEITDAIAELVKMGKKVKVIKLDGWWIDTGKKDTVLEANFAVLDAYAERRIEGDVSDDTRIIGRVIVEKGAVVRSSELRGPAIIGAGAVVENSSIGPFTCIGNDSEIKDSTISYSVFLDKVSVIGVHGVMDSLVGKNATISMKGAPKVKLFIGDDASVEL